MRFEEFRSAYEQSYDGVVMYREVEGDMETPVSLLSRMLNEENMFLLESAREDKTYSRYSFLSFKPESVFRIDAGSVKRVFLPRRLYKNKNLGDFCGGYVGYFAYEAVSLFDVLRYPLRKMPEELGVFFEVKEFVVYDNYTDRMYLCRVHMFDRSVSVERNYNEAISRMDEFEERLSSLERKSASGMEKPRICDCMFSRDEFMERVAYIRGLIESGEAIQVVVSNYFDVENLDPFRFYRALRRINPSPYMYFIKHGEHFIVGSSPEIHVRKRGRIATIKPIAGTKPKGANRRKTEELKKELLEDEKERAEHLMLVDLARNDLSRVCEAGSVEVSSFMQAEEYSHVIHLVSEVNGRLRDDVGLYELIEGTFPAGTLSGAPKVRAMEIIDEVEKSPRGAYGGCVGYIGFNGNVDLAITIRTAIFRGKTARLQAGAGIVYDSVPEKEYQETMNKLGALLKAGGIDDSLDR